MSETPLAIETTNLTRRFGKHIAVNELNLRIVPGTIYGFIGPNGAGKTTTLRMLAGLLEPSSGVIRLQGHEQGRRSRPAHDLIGYMPDFFGVYEDLRVWEYLDFYARCHDIPPAERATTVDGLLDLVDLAEKRNAFVQHLSRGMQQRLCLAHALVHDPAILLLDEPASGLDPQARLELRELLRTLRDMGKTIILSSHILSELEDICTSAGIMAKGQLLANGTIAELAQLSSQQLTIRVRGERGEAARVLATQPGITDVRYGMDPQSIHADYSGGDAEAELLLRALFEAQVGLIDFHRASGGLEGLFLRLLGPAVLAQEEQPA